MLVVLYGREIWPITLRQEHRLGVFLNKVLRNRYGLWKDKVSRSWRKLRNKELHDFYSLPSFIRVIKKEDELGKACDTNQREEKLIEFWRLNLKK